MSKFRELSELQTEYLDLFISHLRGLKISNDYLSPSRSSDLSDELYSLLEDNHVNDKTLEIYNSFVSLLHDLVDKE